ncbi:hypothetical protein BGZ98_001774, partial [Dissophora globulifera]
MLRNPFSLSPGTLSPQQTLELANLHLENARKTKDPEISLVLCHDAEAALSRIKRVAKKSLKTPLSVEDQALRDGFAAAYFEHGSLLEQLDHIEMAKVSYRNAEKMGLVQGINHPLFHSSQLGKSKEMSSFSVTNHSPTPIGRTDPQVHGLAHVPPSIFSQDVAPAAAKYHLPRAGARLESTPQLAYCLGLLPTSPASVKMLDEAEQAWSLAKADDEDEQDRLRTVVTDLTKAFIND